MAVGTKKNQYKKEQAALEKLAALFAKHGEIREAYFLETNGERSGGIVGLFCTKISAEDRFGLIAEIAEISRTVYGEGGALDVFDDLAHPSSNSWEIFSPIAPFYTLEETVERAQSLSAKVDVETTNKQTETADALNFESKPQQKRGRLVGKLFSLLNH